MISNRADKEEVRQDIHVDPAILGAGDHHGSTFYQHQKFLELVRSGKGEPEVSARDGFWSVAIGAAAEQSAKTGKAIEISI